MKKVCVFFLTWLLSFCVNANALKSLNILMITDKFPWSSRPFINNQIAGLTARGHKVHVLATTKQKDAALPQCLQEYDTNTYVHYQRLPRKLTTFDVILVQFPQSSGAQQIYEKHRKGKLKGKLILFFRGEDLSAMIKKDEHRYDQLFKQASLCLPVCHYFKDRLISLGCPPEKIHVIHSAIECDKFAFKERHINPRKKISLISACRLVQKKGIKYAVLAAIRAHDKFPSLDYTIIGDGPEREMISEIIQHFDAQGYIHLKGQLPHDKVARELQKADIFILPSITAMHGDQEGIPNALMEAMATGLPVISSYHAGIPELVQDRHTGLLAVERDVETLVDALCYIIEHPQEVSLMTKQARSYVEQAHNTLLENDALEELLLKICR